jgi:hypothetical protein
MEYWFGNSMDSANALKEMVSFLFNSSIPVDFAGWSQR